MATPAAFAGVAAPPTRWCGAPHAGPPLTRQLRQPLPSRRRRRHHHHHQPLLPTAVADGPCRRGPVTGAVGGKGAASDDGGDGVAGSGGGTGGGGTGDSVDSGRGVRRIATEAEEPVVTAAGSPAADPHDLTRTDPTAGGVAGGVPLPSPPPPPPPSVPPPLRRGIGTFADLSDGTSAAHIYVGGIAVPRHRWSRRHRAAGVYRSVEYRVTGLAAVDAATGARTPYASTADAAAAGVPPADVVASLVPARRLLPRFDRPGPGGWPVEVGVTDARLLSFKADIACSLAVTLALSASFLALGIGGPSIASVYVINSASMEPTVAVGDALVVEKVSLRGLTRGGAGMASAAVAAAAATPATPAAAAAAPLPGASAAGNSAGPAALPLPSGPRVGEVVLFHPPAALRQRAAADGTVLHAKDAFVKRVVAVAGDTVEVRGGVVSVNGVRLGGVPAGADGEGAMAAHGGGGGGAPAAAVAAARTGQPVSDAPSASATAAAAAAAQPPPAGRLRRGGGGSGGSGGGGGGGAPPPDARLVVGDGQLFVLGDNAPHSCDSRYWGLLPVADVVGRPVGRVWPPSRAAVTRLGGPPAAAATAATATRGAAADGAAPSAGASVAAALGEGRARGGGVLWPAPLPPP